MTWGLLVLSVNVVYLVVSLVIGIIIIGFVFKKWKIGIATFLIIALAPFWDLIIQKGIKTYYQTFKMESKIYSYPELDERGKIDSLDITEESGGFPLSSLSKYLNLNYKDNIFEKVSIEKFKINGFNNWLHFDDKIKNFLDTEIFDDNRIRKKVRIRFDDIKPQFEFIEKGTARYKIVKKSKKYLFDLYTVHNYLLTDNKTGEILAKDMSVDFKRGSKSRFRNKFLLWVGANGSQFSIGSIKKIGIMQQILKLKNIG
jgi:hypothetical protein